MRYALCLLFVSAGLSHFLKPKFFVDIVPPRLPNPRAWVYFTGVCEILGGAGLLFEPLRAAAGWGLIALLICVFPANVLMFRRGLAEGWSAKTALLALRLPLQGVLIYWVYAAALMTLLLTLVVAPVEARQGPPLMARAQPRDQRPAR